MYADVAGRPHSLALRPAQDAYRSMPGTPLGMEPQGANAVDLAAAMNHARMGLDGQDYFLGAQRFPPGIMRSRPPMPPGMGNDWNHENAQMNRSMGNMLPYQERDRERDLEDQTRKVSGLILIFIEIPLLLRICPTSEKFDVFIRRFTTNYMRAGMYGLMSLIQWLSLIRKTTSLVAAAVLLIAAAICYLIAGLKGQGFVGSKTLGGQGVAQMIV
ncbi:MAG: hypothetical protein Q9202_002508 [Teloschistes flavicans]